MPPADLLIDPELLLRDAISGVAVTAYSRGINITAHVDNRLPGLLTPGAADLAAFMRRGLLRMIEQEQGGTIALGLWLEEVAPAGGVRALLEVSRGLDRGAAPVLRLTDLWTLPLGGDTARPTVGRCDGVQESVLIPLWFTAAPDAPDIGRRRRGIFQGRRLLHASDVLLDHERLRQSMAAIGAALDFAETPDAALEALLTGAAAGPEFDAVMMDATGGAAASVDLARRIRAAPELGRTRIVLLNVPRGAVIAEQEAAMFDVMRHAASPWRRLMDVLQDLFRRDPGGAQTPRAEASAGIGGGVVPVLAGRRILVAEDVATNQVLLQAVLTHTGAVIEVVSDGATVIERHRADPADLIVMDLQMPGMGGIAALRRIRALGGAAGAVPVVALTAYAGNADRRKALEAGMDGYLAKPIIVGEFYQLLHRLLPPEDAPRDGS